MAKGFARVTKERLDGWFNLLSGVGVRDRDKRVNNDWELTRLSEVEAETLYAADDLASKIVDLLPEDALREWIELKLSDQDAESATLAKLDSLLARTRIETGWKWGRLYGGAGVYVTIDDGLDPQEPVDETKIMDVKSLTVLSRYELVPYQINSNLDSPYFGMPEIYRLQTSQPTDFVERYIHHSRLLRFDGSMLPRRLLIENQWWGDSVFSRTLNAIRNYNSANDAAVSALQDFSVGVFQIKNLAELISSGREDIVRTRLELANYSKSVIKSIVLDSDEQFSQVSKSLVGVSELLKDAGARLVVASGMPHTKILGESPSGLGATGDSEERGWYDHVKNQQKLVLRPVMEKLIRYILLSKNGPTKGEVPDAYTFDFVPLWQMSDKEKADMQLVVAQKDQIYIQNGVVDPDEIAHSRFGGDKFSLETDIDLDVRRKIPSPASESGVSKATTEDPTPKGSTEDPDPAPVNTAEEQNEKFVQTPKPGYVSRTDATK